MLRQIAAEPSQAVEGGRFTPGHLFASRFRIVSPLGRGGMGEVYRAEDLRLGQAVALKLLSPVASGSRDDALERFTREVRLARGIVHANVCRVYDIGEADGWIYLSMEYVDGETLASLRSRIGRLPPEKALDVARQLCAGLAAAHAHGVLHRDLKPSNIMLDGRGRVRIMDFGVAARLDEPIRDLAGTPAYMAPEQLASGVATPRTDVFALGLILYEVFTGCAPFDGRTFDLSHRASFEPHALGFPGGTDPEVASVVRACLARNPADRPTSAVEVGANLPGGDAFTAALAEGRVLPPDLVASAVTSRPMAPPLAWLMLVSAFVGLLIVAAGNSALTVAAQDIPKPPEVLAETARQVLLRVGHTAPAADQAFWFDSAVRSGQARALRFVYRTSPRPLVPQNLFHYVTTSDPPSDVDGMATVSLDLSGRLVSLTRVATARVPASHQPAWDVLFGAAGLTIDQFEQVPATDGPVLPHDTLLAWRAREPGGSPARISAALLVGRPVYFSIESPVSETPPPRVLSTRRSAAGETALWIAIVVIFTATIAMVRRNVRRGEGDLRGALRLAVFVVAGGVASTLLRAHHVPSPLEELVLAISIVGWSLVWGLFSWLSYVAFEPHVRRLWPRTIVSWTRVLAGRWRDPLVGRDLLLGVLAGITLAGAGVLQVLINRHPPSDPLVALALDALLSPGHLLAAMIFAAVDALQYALGALFMLLLLRLVLRATWPAVAVLVAFSLLLAENAGIIYALAGATLFFVVVLRVGIVAGAAMLITQRLLTRIPLTLDLTVWHAAPAAVVMALVMAWALWGCTSAIGRRVPAPGA